MEQLRMSAGKDNERVVQILTDLMKTNKEFQIMITVPASGASSLSEMAMGLKWGKPVFVLYGGIELPGAVGANDVEDMLAKVLESLLGPIG